MARRALVTLTGMVLALVTGCVSVNYVETNYAPTEAVDVFFSPDDVRRPYTVMGQATAEVDVLPFVSSGQGLQAKLVEEARRRGANAVILGGMTKRTVGGTTQTTGQADRRKKKDAAYSETSTTSDDERAELTGTLIRYQ
jgi:hypothetical protein